MVLILLKLVLISLHTTRVAQIKNTDKTKCWWCGAVTISYIADRMQNGTATLEVGVMLSYKVKHMICQSHFQAFIQKKWKCVFTWWLVPKVHSSIIHNAKNWKQPKCSPTCE